MGLEAEATLQGAIAELIATKAEHRRILQQIAADPGMTPETRRTLIEHLCEEEDEHMAHIAALASGTPAASSAPVGGPDHGAAFTVGSLRVEAAPPTTLGSLSRNR